MAEPKNTSGVRFHIWTNPSGKLGCSQSRERFRGGFLELEFMIGEDFDGTSSLKYLETAKAAGYEISDTRAVQS